MFSFSQSNILFLPHNLQIFSTCHNHLTLFSTIFLIIDDTSSLSNILIFNFIISSFTTHTLQRPHICYTYFILSLILNSTTLCLVQIYRSYHNLIKISLQLERYVVSHKTLDALHHFNHLAWIRWFTTPIFIHHSIKHFFFCWTYNSYTPSYFCLGKKYVFLMLVSKFSTSYLNLSTTLQEVLYHLQKKYAS